MRIVLLFLFCFSHLLLSALVRYDEGMLSINGITLLQDSRNPNFYHYLPPYPRLAQNQAGDLDFLCLKYLGKGVGDANGGLFHALISMALPQETLLALETALKARFPQARIVGPVELVAPMSEEGKPALGFRLVSSILPRQEGQNVFVNEMLTSGRAPYLPGAKAAIAARLSPEGTSLLWESFSMATSDVSVQIEGQYEALMNAYNAVIKADLHLVYDHFKLIGGKNTAYFDQARIRGAMDSLARKGVIQIQSFDRSAGTGIRAENMDLILNLITEKILIQLFDLSIGCRKEKQDSMPGIARESYRAGALLPYYAAVGALSDKSFRLKDKKNIRSFHFYLNLTQSVSVMVPFQVSGNLRGFFDCYKNDAQYFKVVDLESTDYQQRTVFVQLDESAVDAFSDLVNEVSFSFRKIRGDDEAASTEDFQFIKKAVGEGKLVQVLQYARAGEEGRAWLDYEYKVGWSLKGIDSIVGAGYWRKSSDPALVLYPPFSRKTLEVEADGEQFRNAGVRSCSIRFSTLLFGEPTPPRTLVFQGGAAQFHQFISLYADPAAPVVYQVSWFTDKGEIRDPGKLLDIDFLYLSPPIGGEPLRH